MAKKNYVIGFDLGGTKMLAAVYDDDYEIKGRYKQKTLGQEEPEAIYGRIEETIHEALDDAGISADDLQGIGIGSPGPLDIHKGRVLDTPNLNLNQFPLSDRLEKAFGCPVLLDNDVSVGTYGEFRFGAAKGYQHVVGIFPGTGIGGGLVLNGQLFRGATGAAGEIGHTIIQVNGPLCGCGQHGCLEALASKSAIAKDAVALAASGSSPAILDHAGTDIKQITSKSIKKAIKAGEAPMTRVLERSAEFLGIGMANCVNIISPDVVVIGGGLVEKFGNDYLSIAEASMRRHAMPFLVDKVNVVEATLGDDAVILGAASLFRAERL